MSIWIRKVGDEMIPAVLNGKSANTEYSEDMLTSTVFGTLRYLLPVNAIIPFIESAFLYDNIRTELWQILVSEGIDLRCYKQVEYIFWARHPNFGEPDLMLLFTDNIHGCEDFLLPIEVKFKSGKSGIGEYDQLKRYYTALNEDIISFNESAVSNYKNKCKYVVYLTEHDAISDIEESKKQIIKSSGEFSGQILHLRWHQLFKVLESMQDVYSFTEQTIADDLMNFLEKLGLRDFSGFSLPDDSIRETVSFPYPVFFLYNELKENLNHKSLFDKLPEMNINQGTYCFYRGE